VKHENKNYTHKIEDYLFELNYARLMAHAEGFLDCIIIACDKLFVR
jgi:hypothetical protein